MPKRSKKMASLSGSLLVQKGSEPAVGFVLRSPDKATKRPGPGPKVTGPESRQAKGGPTLHEGVGQETRQSESARQDVDVAKPPRLERGGVVELGSKPPGADHAAAVRDFGPSDFLAALRQGNLAEAEEIFGRLTGLDPERSKRVLYSPGGRNLALACKALGAEQLQFVSILILTRKLGPNGASLNARQLTDLVSYFLDISEITANRVLNQWRAEYIEVFGEQS